VSVEGFTKAKAYVTIRDSKQAGAELAAELRQFCGAKLHRYQVPELVEFVDNLPKTATGKIERYKLRPPV
jgi:benzoate-CoA ligase